MSDYTHKQVIVIRKDLKMRRGKECAQSAHASLGAILGLGTYQNNNTELLLKLDGRSIPWLTGRFAKICVTVNSEKELLDLQKQAEEKGLINCLIQDSGFTEFSNIPTYTTLAIGPDHREKIDEITKHLKLY